MDREIEQGFLDHLNHTLWEWGGQPYCRHGMIETMHPFYFVVGPPRSGTTLLTQLLAYVFDLGYVTNIAARFWDAPTTGMMLSRCILGDRPVPSFRSRYASTDTAGDIHEFGRFWRRHFGWESAADADCVRWFFETRNGAHLLEELAGMSHVWGRPSVMKGIYPAYAADDGLGWFASDKAHFINIERDTLDTCISILDARRANGDEREWFGWHLPKGVRGDVEMLDPYAQIARQVCWFKDYYRCISDITLTLERLCLRTDKLLEDLARSLGLEPVRELPDGALRLNCYMDRGDDKRRFAAEIMRISEDWR